MNLYLINKVIQDVMDEHIDYETSEISELGAQKLDELELEKEDLIDQMIKAYKNQQILLDGLSAEMDRLKKRKENLESTQQSILKQVRPHLTEGEKRVTPEYELKWTTSTKVGGLDDLDPQLEMNDEDSQLKKFVKRVVKETYSFDKTAIKKELKKENADLPISVFVNQTKNIKIN